MVSASRLPVPGALLLLSTGLRLLGFGLFRRLGSAWLDSSPLFANLIRAIERLPTDRLLPCTPCRLENCSHSAQAERRRNDDRARGGSEIRDFLQQPDFQKEIADILRDVPAQLLLGG